METYQAGYISIESGSDMVEGFGTRWLNYIQANDQLMLDGIAYPIATVTDNHLLQLTAAYEGVAIEHANYEIMTFPAAQSLEDLKLEAAAEIDRLAGDIRMQYITYAPGQELTYTAKLDDAKAYIAAGYPADASQYVWIAAEATATGSTPQYIADVIVATAAQWAIVGAQIEGARMAAKQAISAAASIADISAAQQAFADAISQLSA
jgi:hypothetical protein